LKSSLTEERIGLRSKWIMKNEDGSCRLKRKKEIKEFRQA